MMTVTMSLPEDLLESCHAGDVELVMMAHQGVNIEQALGL